MAPIIFYGDLKSQPCRALYIFLKVNNIPYTFHKVDLFAGDQYQDEFTKVSPIQRVPVIDDNGFILGESASIFRYLASKFSVPDHWYPSSDLQKRARVDEYLNWHHTNTRTQAMMTFRHKFINTMRGKPLNKPEIAMHEKLLKKVVAHIDTYFLKDSPFLCGDEISVADLQAACELYQLNGVGDQALYTSNVKVNAWMERLRTRLQPHFECNVTESEEFNTIYQQRLANSNL